jgi:hypothetical protein
MRLKKTLVGTLATAVAAVCIVAGTALAHGAKPKSASNSVRVSSHLRAAAKYGSAAPAAIIDLVNSMIADAGGDSATATQTLRDVQADVGSAHESLYTFQPTTSMTCFILWKRTAACPNAQTESLHPGVVFVGGGGIPAWGSPTGSSVPSILVGTADTNVKAISLIQDGRAQQLPIVSSTFFTELTPAAGTAPDTLQLVYRDGHSTSIRIPAPDS